MTATTNSDTVPMPPLQPVLPQLAYRDIGAALAWLERAFGFRVRP